MRGTPLLAGITMVLMASACGSSTASTPFPSPSSVNTCAAAKAYPRLAYLVVEHLSGRTVERCAGFSGSTVDGETLMRQSAIRYLANTDSAGRVICQIDSEPLEASACGEEDQPHWMGWVDIGGAWTPLSGSYAGVQLHDHEALGWRYVVPGGAAPSPPPLPRPL